MQRPTFSVPHPLGPLHACCHAYLTLTLPPLSFRLCSFRCSVDSTGDWSAGSPLFSSLESAAGGGGRLSAFPLYLSPPRVASLTEQSKTARHWSTQHRPPSALALLGSVQLISSPRRAQQLRKTHLLPSDPSQPSLPRHNGAITTATRRIVSCHHTIIVTLQAKYFKDALGLCGSRFVDAQMLVAGTWSHLARRPVKPHFCVSAILKACSMFQRFAFLSAQLQNWSNI